MAKIGFWSFFWKRLNKMYIGSSTFILFILAFLPFYLNNTYTIRLGWILLAISAFIILILSFYSVSIKLYSESQETIFAQIIRVLNLEESARDRRTKAVYLIRPSRLFQEGSLVSFYYNYHEDLEDLIGIGLVTNASAMVTQIELSYITEKHSSVIGKLLVKDKDVLDKVKIKPLVIEKELNELISREVPEDV